MLHVRWWCNMQHASSHMFCALLYDGCSVRARVGNGQLARVNAASRFSWCLCVCVCSAPFCDVLVVSTSARGAVSYLATVIYDVVVGGARAAAAALLVYNTVPWPHIATCQPAAVLCECS